MQCRQCLKERNENEFRTIAGGTTYKYCRHCEALNKKLTYLHRNGRGDTDEAQAIVSTMRELQRRGGELIKQVDRIINGEKSSTDVLIKEVL